MYVWEQNGEQDIRQSGEWDDYSIGGRQQVEFEQKVKTNMRKKDLSWDKKREGGSVYRG